MSHFPGPLSLPESIVQERGARTRQVLRAAQGGIFVRLVIIFVELLGYYWFSSSALLMDAVSSSIDVLSSLVLVLCVWMASRPPDIDHPFGHGRYEPLAGMQLGIILVFVGSGTLFQQIYATVSESTHGEINARAWLIPFFATCLLEICYQMVIRVAKKQNSPALAADAVHYRIDGLTSLFATLALGVGALFPEASVLFDRLGAATIAVLMVVIGVGATRKNLHQVMDRSPGVDFFEKVRKASKGVPGVLGTEKVRIQIYGPDAHVDIDIEVDPSLPVEEAHKISQQVRWEIQKEWPSVRDVTVHIEPYYPNDH